MKNLFNLSALLAITLFVGCTYDSNFQFSGPPYLSKTFTINTPGNLEVKTSGSPVSVIGTSGNSVIVDMYVNYQGDEIDTESAEVEALLEDYELDISQSGNKIILIAKRKGSIGWDFSNRLNLAFKLAVPYEMSAAIKSSGGSISLTEITGSHEINTSGGSIKVFKSEGELISRSSGGSFRLEEFFGDVSVQTSGGSVKVSQLTGNLKVGSSGGSVNLDEIDGSIDASTSGGSIKAQLSNLENSLTMKSSGGSITAVVPNGIGLDLDLSGGRVNASLDKFSGENKKDKVVGKLNGGGIPVTMKSSGGSINLEFEGKN